MVQTKICNLCRKEKDLQEFKAKLNGEICKNCIKCNDLAKMYAVRVSVHTKNEKPTVENVADRRFVRTEGKDQRVKSVTMQSK